MEFYWLPCKNITADYQETDGSRFYILSSFSYIFIFAEVHFVGWEHSQQKQNQTNQNLPTGDSPDPSKLLFE